MSNSKTTINLDTRRLISIAFLMAIIFALISIIMAGPFLLASTQPIDNYVTPVGGTILPVEVAITPAISMVIFATIAVAATALTAIIFKSRK